MASKAEAMAKMRRGMITAGAGIGLVVVSPVFYVVASFVTAEQPRRAEAIVDTKWVSEDGESTIALSKRNVAKFSNFPGLGTGKGLVRWTDGGLEIGWPIKGFTQLTVSEWPAAAETSQGDEASPCKLVLNDTVLVKDEGQRV